MRFIRRNDKKISGITKYSLSLSNKLNATFQNKSDGENGNMVMFWVGTE
jgi:hypothetical protein